LISGVTPVGRWFSGLVVWCLAHLPRRALGWLAASLASLAYVLGVRRRVALENLREAFPDKSEAERRRIARGAYRNMALVALESLVAAHLKDRDVEEGLRISNFDALEAACRSGSGVLVATAHFGNWEVLGSVMCRRGFAMSTVVKPLSGAFNARIIEARQRNGMTLIPARGALKGTLRAVRGGGIVVMLLDQVLPAEHGVFVPFFGRLASTNPALSVAALRTGAPVFVVMGEREQDRLHMSCEGPFPVPRTGDSSADVTAHTAMITAVLERHIRAHPEQWLWMHRRWKVQPQIDQTQK
jgi:Kdo2-lipid IVA lauroyltransferase/acyltransferase